MPKVTAEARAKPKLTWEERAALREIRERRSAREKLITGVRKADAPGFDELMRLVEEIGPAVVLRWALAGQEAESKGPPTRYPLAVAAAAAAE